jgi:serine/threonine protein kinase
MADVSVIEDNPNLRIDNEEKKVDRLEILSIIIKDRFEIIKRLGSGSFGEVFLAKDIQTNSLCALKTERIDAKHPQLRIEQQIFLRMENCKIIFDLLSIIYIYKFLGKGYPSIISLIEEKDFLILAMDLLGPSLEDLLNFCQRQFSKKTILMLIDQAFFRVQLMHERSLIHRDVRNKKKTNSN